MGSRASVRVCYGIDYGAEEEGDNAAKFGDSPEPKDTSTPAGLVYFGAPKESPVEVVTYGHHDYRRYVLAANHLTVCGRAFAPIDLSQVDLEPNISTVDEAIRSYCETHGLTYCQPRWLAVPYYG